MQNNNVYAQPLKTESDRLLVQAFTKITDPADQRIQFVNNLFFQSGVQDDDINPNSHVVMHDKDLDGMVSWFLEQSKIENVEGDYFVSVIIGCTENEESLCANLNISRERG